MLMVSYYQAWRNPCANGATAQHRRAPRAPYQNSCMHTRRRRIQQLEAALGSTTPVYAFYFADTNAYQVVIGAPTEHLPAALFWERYPTAQIVSRLAMAAMWDAL